jgi:hypothetical protein
VLPLVSELDGRFVISPQAHLHSQRMPLVLVFLSNFLITVSEPNVLPVKSVKLYFILLRNLQPQEVLFGFLLLRLQVNTCTSLPHSHSQSQELRFFFPSFWNGAGLIAVSNPNFLPVRSTRCILSPYMVSITYFMWERKLKKTRLRS